MIKSLIVALQLVAHSAHAVRPLLQVGFSFVDTTLCRRCAMSVCMCASLTDPFFQFLLLLRAGPQTFR